MKRRRGWTIIELVYTFMVLAVLATAIACLLSLSGRSLSALEARSLAFEEAANILEQIASRTPAELVPAEIEKIDVSPRFREIFPQCERTIELLEQSEDGLQRCVVRVHLDKEKKLVNRPGQLTAWLATKGGKP